MAFQQGGLRGLSRVVMRKAINELFFVLPTDYQKDVLIASHRLRHRFLPRSYIPNNPYEPIYIDPSEVVYHVNHNQAPKGFGRIVGGDWDLKRERFDDTIVYQSLEDRFKHGEPWENTGFFEYLLSKPDWMFWDREYDSEETRNEYLRQIDKLYKKISEDGYRTQKELLERERADTLTLNNDGSHPYFNEIGINIGRNGEFLWRHRGLHRLSIAKILELDQIPVQTRTCHTQWCVRRKTRRK